MTTTMERTYTDSQMATIERVAEQMADPSGYYRNGITSRFIGGFDHQWMIKPEDISRAFAELGVLAATGDASLAEAALVLMRAINPHAARKDFEAAIWNALGDVFSKGFDDVVKRTGPEPIRHSEAQRKHSLAEALLIVFYADRVRSSHNRPGWCFDYLIRREARNGENGENGHLAFALQCAVRKMDSESK
jgi:hypothetical protein